MNVNQSTARLSQLGSRHPRPFAILSVAVGIWLLVLTAILYSAGGGGEWEWVLVALVALHFALAYRLMRIARKAADPRMRMS